MHSGTRIFGLCGLLGVFGIAVLCCKGQPPTQPSSPPPAAPIASSTDAPTDIVSLVPGTTSCAVYGSGALRCWGKVPPIVEITDAIALNHGDGHGVYVLRRDHSVVEIEPRRLFPIATDIRALGAWGTAIGVDGAAYFEVGQSKIPGIHDAVSIAGSEHHFGAVLANGHVACYGSNGYGQLGVALGPTQDDPDMPTTSTKAPVMVPGIDDARFVSAGLEHSCVVHADGRVSCWGSGYQGNLGRRL